MAVTIGSPAPYTAPSAIIEVVERYRSKGLPTPVNAEVLDRAGVAESLIPRTLQALRALDLIDAEGKPTSIMDGLRKAPEAEYKTRLVEWLNGAYADALQFIDPATATETEIQDAFRHYEPFGQLRRMVILFSALYAHAGIGPERAKAARKATPASKPKAATVQRETQRRDPPPNKPTPPAPPSGLHPALAGLLASLPAQGDSWTKEERDSFYATFGAVLNFCFPVTATGTPKASQQPEQGGAEI